MRWFVFGGTGGVIGHGENTIDEAVCSAILGTLSAGIGPDRRGVSLPKIRTPL